MKVKKIMNTKAFLSLVICILFQNKFIFSEEIEINSIDNSTVIFSIVVSSKTNEIDAWLIKSNKFIENKSFHWKKKSFRWINSIEKVKFVYLLFNRFFDMVNDHRVHFIQTIPIKITVGLVALEPWHRWITFFNWKYLQNWKKILKLKTMVYWQNPSNISARCSSGI